MSDLFSVTMSGIAKRTETIESDGRITETFTPAEKPVEVTLPDPAPASNDDTGTFQSVTISELMMAERESFYLACRGCGEVFLVDNPEHELLYIHDGEVSLYCNGGPSCVP